MEEKPKTIYFTDDANSGIINPDMSNDGPYDESFAETGVVVVYLFVSIALVAIIAILLYFTFCN